MVVVALIPARGGSKRLPEKNKKNLLEKPLIVWTIECALKILNESDFLDDIILTTDDPEIQEIGGWMYDQIRVIEEPEYLASDLSPMWAVVEHALQDYPDDTVVILLQPTSPLRTALDVISCFRLFQLYKKTAGVVSVYHEYPMHEMIINGAVYIHSLGTIRATKSFVHTGIITYIMPYERSIDIDTSENFEECERLLQKRLNI